MKKQTKECPCPWNDCPRHANCDACKDYHSHRGEKTSCEKQARG